MMTPRHHTPRTPGSRTLGGKAAAVAKAMGRPLHDWQRRAADVAFELDDNGRLRYRTVYISVPRQCGKTVLDMVGGVTRMLLQDDAKVWYTAQTGQSARERWVKEVATPIGTRLPSLGHIKRGAGDTRLTIPTTGSEFRPMPPSAEYLHGSQSDKVLVDEAWVHDDASGAALMQAVAPTFQSRAGTRLGIQLWLSSTAGTADSTWWHNGLDNAIDGQGDTAVIDYGIPDGVEPTDVDAVIAAHPLGGDPAIADFIRDQALALPGGEFARAYGNRRTAARDRAIELDAWRAAQTLVAMPASTPVVFGAAIDINRTETVIAACGLVGDIPYIEIVDRRPGTAWAADRLVDLVDAHGAPPPIIDPIGPSGTLHDELVGRGVDCPTFTVRDLTRACANFMDRITHTDDNGDPDPRVGIRPDDGLEAAVDTVEIRNVGDAWAWKRDVIGSIAALEAATLALHGVTHRPTDPVAPLIYI